MIKVGIVGYGFAGRGLHRYLVDRTPGLQLAGVVSSQTIADVKTFANLDQLLAEKDIGLVIIATPHLLHAEQAINVMNAGKHCVVDKVMCMNVAEVDAMIASAKSNKVLLSVFQNRRWDWDFLTVQKALQHGWIGEPFRFESRVSRYRPPQRWRAQKELMGGILFDWGPHLIDQALQLIPSPVNTVYCHISNLHWGMDIGTHCQLVLTFANDVVYEIEISYLCHTKRPRWTVLGTLGAMTKYGLDPQEAAILSGDLAAAHEDPANHLQIEYEDHGVSRQMTIESVQGSWQGYYQNIVNVLNGQDELIVKPEQVKTQIQIIESAMQSARSGQTVSIIQARL